ncbi:MAG: hypothetical protein HY238_25290 [Acidobacteria bacterium]|nr:hypothetical protein [Acidobacteriota bacterium]
MNHSRPLPWLRVYLGVAATTMATLLFELALTRIFSVVLFYHFAFMAISVALFGLGAGAICSYYWTDRQVSASLWNRLGLLSSLNVLATALVLLVILQQRVSIEVSAANAGKLALIYFVSAVPFFLAGMVLSLAIAETVERVDRVYFFDLLGAAAGCLALVPLLDLVGGPNTVLAAAALYGVGGVLWFGVGAGSREERGGRREERRGGWVAGGLVVMVGGFIFLNLHAKWVDVRFAKGKRLEYEVFSRWNSFSRVAVKPDDGGGNPAIVIDADAATSIPGLALERLDPRTRAELLQNGPALPYLIRPGARTLIIGPGGGFDVARALASGSRDVTGVEINPIIVNDIMRNRFAERSRHLYSRPEVRIQIEDGRSYVRRSREKYQVIQMTLVDTWASTAAGAFALSENNLYTTEAFRDYLEDLTDDGMLAITRWEFDPPRESLRVVSLGVEALRQMGAAEPWRHFLIARENAQDLTGYGAKDTVILKRTPFTGEEIARAREAMSAARMPAVYVPGERIANPFTELLLAPDPLRFAQHYRYDITPVTDNRPFFFYTVRSGELWGFITGRRSEDVKINIGVMMLFVLLGASVAGTAVILLLPPLLPGTRLPRERSAFAHLGYFFAIGVGYIMVEVGLIQRFVLFLGRPTYSLTVVVFSLLVASGLGSYASRRVVGERDGRLMTALAGVMLVVGMLGLVVAPVLQAGVGLPLAAKCAVSVALLFPAGFVMGMPFPSGLKRLEKRHPAAVRWAWAMNSASSVLGSVTAVFCAIHLGLSQTLFLGGGAYLVALMAVRGTARRGRDLRI